eukprot:593075-Prorocentrum_minimum.AAC.1
MERCHGGIHLEQPILTHRTKAVQVLDLVRKFYYALQERLLRALELYYQTAGRCLELHVLGAVPLGSEARDLQPL